MIFCRRVTSIHWPMTLNLLLQNQLFCGHIIATATGINLQLGHVMCIPNTPTIVFSLIVTPECCILDNRI